MKVLGLKTLFDRAFEYIFLLLFCLTPFIFTSVNFELFEFPKMIFVYFLAGTALSLWILKMILSGMVILRFGPFGILMLFFLASQIISAVFSIDPHVSLFGYYSRFNGGILSSFAYTVLYFSFVSNFPRDKILKLLKGMLISSLAVSLYAVLERLGIDKNLWVQDVQTRVFSTLGQPNWLAAYILPCLSIALFFLIKNQPASPKLTPSTYLLSLPAVSSLFFILTLVFTKSRSGFIGLFFLILGFIPLIISPRYRQSLIRIFISLTLLTGLSLFLFQTPWQSANSFTLRGILDKTSGNIQVEAPVNIPAPQVTSLEGGVTDSGDIRKIVWKGAVDIFFANPIFGTGPETFAYSYYAYRPLEHNNTSEWDFLYNKAHNEYLNFLANTGAIGFSAYTLYLTAVLVFLLKNTLKGKFTTRVLSASFLASTLSIAATNFFGFSTVILNIYLFLLPAILYIAKSPQTLKTDAIPPAGNSKYQAFFRILLIPLPLLLFLFTTGAVSSMWIADYYFAKARNLVQKKEIVTAREYFKKSINLFPLEPKFYDELSYASSLIAVYAFENDETALSDSLAEEALSLSDTALSISPSNLNFYINRAKTLFSLSQINPDNMLKAREALLKAFALSPTNAKIAYNLAAAHDAMDEPENALKYLNESIRLKNKYYDPLLAKADILIRLGREKEARETLEYILISVRPDDTGAKLLLNEIK